MENRPKVNFGAGSIIGIVFSVIGVVFLTVGLTVGRISTDADAATLTLIFTALGGCFLCAGIGCWAAIISQKRQATRLVAGGRYIWGQITELVPNYSVQVNGRHPRIAIVRYEDGSGIHIFRSRNLYRYPDVSVVGRQVKVYIQNDRFQPYYVDIDPVLPRVIEH